MLVLLLEHPRIPKEQLYIYTKKTCTEHKLLQILYFIGSVSIIMEHFLPVKKKKVFIIIKNTW